MSTSIFLGQTFAKPIFAKRFHGLRETASVILSENRNSSRTWFRIRRNNLWDVRWNWKHCPPLLYEGISGLLWLLDLPGTGKTSLLAQWTKNAQAIRHFIREGDASTYDAMRIFENLGLQLAARYRKFGLQWKRPSRWRCIRLP